MGISPIASLIPLPVARAIEADLEPLPMERVEMSPRTGDETYSPSGEPSGRGAEDGAPDDETVYEASSDEQLGEPDTTTLSQTNVPHPIDLFA